MLETKKRKNVGLDTENKTKKVISNTLLRIILIAATILVIVPITKYVSLGAIIGISMSPIMMVITKNSKGLIATLFLTVSVIYTHRENIKRLLSGTERKLGEKK